MDFYRWMKVEWDRAAAMATAVLGLVAILLGWLGVSRSSLPTEQIPYLASGAVLGLFALGAAATLWLSADLRDEWRKLDEIHRTLTAQAEATLAEPTFEPTPEPVVNGAGRTTRTRAGR